MDFNPLISVVVPVYNGADYVGEAIESILAQSYTNYEIVVVNDGSTDNGATDMAVKPYLDSVTYVKKQNGGVASALNTGIENITGAYFAWLSHDDLFMPNKLESQVQILNDLIDRKVILYSDYGIVNFQKEHLYDVILDADMLNNSSNHMPVLRGCLNGCTMLIHREIFDACGVFDLNLKYTQDYEMWDRMCWKYPMLHQANITVHQRVHDAQDSKRSDAVLECNSLWINLISKRDDKTRTEISGGSLEFLRGMQTFLSHTPYIGAQDFVASEISKLNTSYTQVTKLKSSPLERNKANEVPALIAKSPLPKHIDLSRLSIILNSETSYDEGLRCINALARLKSRDFEVIFIVDENESTVLLAERFEKISKYVRCVKISGDISAARYEAVLLTQNDYVMFLTTRDIVLGNNLSGQLNNMKQTGYGVSYAPYISVCEELSEQGVIVPSHWLKGLSIEDIIGRCAVNISTMIFEKQVLLVSGIPPMRNLKSEIQFLLSIRNNYDIYAFTNVTIISYTKLNMAPLNLTQMLDETSDLIAALEADETLSKSAIDILKYRLNDLYTIRLENEKSGKALSKNASLEAFYQGYGGTNVLIGNTGLLDIENMMETT